MFRPANGQVSRDELREADADWTITESTRQAVHNSTLKLIPLQAPVGPVRMGWPRITWSQEDGLPQGPDEVGARWDAQFNNLTVTSPQLFEFGGISKFLDVHTESGEYEYFRQIAGAGAGKTHWPDNVDNATGWTLEGRVQVLAYETGGTLADYHSIVIDDGVHRERIYITETGFSFENAPSLNVLADLTRPRAFRLGGQDDDLYLILDDGRGLYGANRFTGATVQKELGFGRSASRDMEARTQWDYLHQDHTGNWTDGPATFAKVYTTDGSMAVSPAFAPQQHVDAWQSAYFEISGTLSGGTTQITVQYRSSVTGDLWTDLGTYTVNVLGQFEIDLQSIPTAGNGTDQLRFQVNQVSTSGYTEPPRVETVTVVCRFQEQALRIHPAWGHKDGGNTVVLEVDPQVAYRVGTASMESQGPLAPPLLTDTYQTAAEEEARLLQIPANGDLDDDIGSISATVHPSVVFRDSNHGQAAVLGLFQHTGSLFSQSLASFYSHPTHGDLGTGCTPIHDSLTGSLVCGQKAGPIQTVSAWEPGDGLTVQGTDVLGLTLSFQLQIGRGAVRVTHGSEVHDFYGHDYAQRSVVTIQGDASATGDLTMVALETGSTWEFSSPYTAIPTRPTASLVGCAHAETGAGFGAEVRATPYEFATTTPIVSRINGNRGWEIGVTVGGFPYAKIGDGSTTDTVTGRWPLKIGQERHLALNFRPYDTYQRLQILVDGEVCGEKITTLSTVSSLTSDPVVIGGLICQAEEIAAHSRAYDAARLSVRRGIAWPLFQTETEVAPETENTLILRFDHVAGALVDDSGHAHHPGQTLDGRRGLHRGASISGKRVARFWYEPYQNGTLQVLHAGAFTQSLPQSLFVSGVWYDKGRTQTLYSKWNATGTVGWKVEILSGGTVRVTVEDGVTSHVHTSTALLATGTVKYLGVEVVSTGTRIYIDDESSIQADTLASLAAATEDAEIGRGCTMLVDTFILRAGLLDDFNTWRDPTAKKWSAANLTDRVYVDNVAVDPTRISHYGPTRKYVRMPAGTPGYAPVYILLENGVAMVANRPYRYTYGYRRELPEDVLDGQVFKVESPFRVTATVPRSAIGIAHLQAPDLSVPRNVGLTDLEYLTSENLSTYFGGEFLTSSGVEGTGSVLYAAQVDTQDLRLSNRSVMRRELKEPKPLYYKYLVGRRRYYVHNVNALTVDDIGVIRASIQVQDSDGNAVSIKEYPWEIEVSKQDAFGRALPTNVFAVTLFTGVSHLPQRTVRVVYEAADSLNQWRVIPGFREIINPAPIFRRVESTGDIGQDDYHLSLQEDGTYSLRVWNA